VELKIDTEVEESMSSVAPRLLLAKLAGLFVCVRTTTIRSP
jgi:hypothetical protein